MTSSALLELDDLRLSGVIFLKGANGSGNAKPVNVERESSPDTGRIFKNCNSAPDFNLARFLNKIGLVHTLLRSRAADNEHTSLSLSKSAVNGSTHVVNSPDLSIMRDRANGDGGSDRRCPQPFGGAA